MSYFFSALSYLQDHPKAASIIQWGNPVFTGFAITADLDLAIKVLAFLFVTVPLGIVQWGNAVKYLKERRAKRHADLD